MNGGYLRRVPGFSLKLEKLTCEGTHLSLANVIPVPFPVSAITAVMSKQQCREVG